MATTASIVKDNRDQKYAIRRRRRCRLCGRSRGYYRKFDLCRFSFGYSRMESGPVLAGKRPIYERKFFWRTKRQGAMLRGKWKYIRDSKEEYLYDLLVDEHEQADFARKHPEILNSLRREFDAWESEMAKYPTA